MRGVIEHGVGGDEGSANALCEGCQACDARAIIAAIRVTRGEVETGLRSERLLDVAKLSFEGGYLLPPPERGRAGWGSDLIADSVR